jgi:hypothetical protein
MPRLANGCIRDLNKALADTGETVKLARLTDAPKGDFVPFYCENVPAKIMLAQPQELYALGGGTTQESTAIISPTQLAARQWPAPPRKDDRIYCAFADGRTLTGTIESVDEQRVQGIVVRYDIKWKS